MKLGYRKNGVLGALMLALVVSTVLVGPSSAQAADTGGGSTATNSSDGPSRAGAPDLSGGPSIRTGGTSSVSAALPQTWYGHWFQGPKCTGDICTITSTDSIPRFWISGQDFSFGSVYVGIFRRDGSPILSTDVTAGHWAGFVDASWGWKANMFDCAAIGATVTNNAFIQAFDRLTNRWSNRIFVTTDCSVL